MGEDDNNLTTRYYAAEVFTWLLGGIFVFARFFGLAPDQEIPGLGIKIVDTLNYFRALSGLQVFTAFYLVFEWKASNTTARNARHSQIRLVMTFAWVVVSLWLGYPLITQGTAYNACSPAWPLAFAVLGLAIENFLSVLILAALMIRSREEAKMHGLPRVPAAAGAQFLGWVPILCLLLIAYFFLWYNAPVSIALIAPYLTGLMFLLSFANSAISFCNGHDENGKRLTFRQNVARFRELLDRHDYWYMMANVGMRIKDRIKIAPASRPQEHREAVLKIIEQSSSAQPEQRFHGTTLEEFSILLSPQGSITNEKGSLSGVESITIASTVQDKETLLVRVLYDTEMKSEEMSLPISSVNYYANKYVQENKGTINIQKALSFALDQTIIKVLCARAPYSLHHIVLEGDIKLLSEAIRGDVDVNKRATGGWTPLLSAVANGKRDAANILLEAGANPDLVNANEVTPLIYAARYGDLSMCKLLLKYKANLDVQDMWGNTALMKALLVGSEEVAVYLLECGASLTPKNKDGFNALEIAYRTKKGKLARLIKEKLEEGRTKSQTTEDTN